MANFLVFPVEYNDGVITIKGKKKLPRGHGEGVLVIFEMAKSKTAKVNHKEKAERKKFNFYRLRFRETRKLLANVKGNLSEDVIAERGRRQSTVKEKAKETLEKLPEDATWEDLQYALYVREQVERGLEDVRQGKTIPHKEVVKMFKSRK